MFGEKADRRMLKRMSVCAAALGLTLSAGATLAQDSETLAGALPACSGGATGLVLSVLPVSHNAQLQREGQTGRLHDLAPLCPDDTIVLNAGETAHIELENGRSSSEPIQGPAEFTVPSGRGMLANATLAFSRIIFPEVSERTRTLVTRSQGTLMSPRPENMGLRRTQILSHQSGPRALWFGWTDGIAPFNVTLETEDGEILAQASISAEEAAAIRDSQRSRTGAVSDIEYDVTLPAAALAPGAYRIRVADRNSEPPAVAMMMSDADAGIMSLDFEVRDDVQGVPARNGATDIAASIDAICFSVAEPENRLFEAAQHIVRGRDGTTYSMSISLLGADLSDADSAAMCGG